jgi:hypothetical protein
MTLPALTSRVAAVVIMPQASLLGAEMRAVASENAERLFTPTGVHAHG